MTALSEPPMTLFDNLPEPESPAELCPHCGEPVPPDRCGAVYCSPACVKRARRRRTKRRDFLRNGKKAVPVEAVALHFKTSVEDARARAEVDIKAGRLLGWWSRDGVLVEVSTPRGRRFR